MYKKFLVLQIMLILLQIKVIAKGTPSELIASRDPRVVQFIQGEADNSVHFHYPAQDYMQELFV